MHLATQELTAQHLRHLRFPSPSGDHAFSNINQEIDNEHNIFVFRPLQGIMHLATEVAHV